MGLAITHLEYGSKLLGSAFAFEEPGDTLEWHVHAFDDQHIAIVAKGELRLEIRGEASRTVQAGELIDFPPGVWHQFTALTADARLFNFFKEGPRNGQAS